jgi:hypothetical protein
VLPSYQFAAVLVTLKVLGFEAAHKYFKTQMDLASAAFSHSYAL